MIYIRWRQTASTNTERVIKMKIKKINKTDINRVNEIMIEMKTLGSPNVRAFDYDGMYYAIEGSHRIQAAKNLGIGVNVITVEYGDEMLCDLDLNDSAITEAPASEVWDYIFDADGEIIEF